MVHFTTIIKKFDKQGDKTGWTYIDVPEEIAGQMKPGNRKSFRVRGTLDGHYFQGAALVPMGGGNFILALNAAMRKAIKKAKGDMLSVKMEADPDEPQISPLLLECLEDEPAAKAYFNSIPRSHQLYYSRWIDSAKTDTTATRRIAMAVNAMAQGIDYGQMIRNAKSEKALLGK